MSKTIATQWKLFSKRDDQGGSVSTEKSTSHDQFRKMLVRGDVLNGSAGSAYVEMGDTKVMCSISGPKEQQGGDYSQGGTLNVTLYGMDSTSLRFTIASALNAVVCLKKLAKAKVDVQLNVLADDGGVLACSLMAATVGLSSAGIECFDLVLACQILVVQQGENAQTTILDPTQNQMRKFSGAAANLTVGIMPSLGQIVCLDVNGPIRKGVLGKTIEYAFQKCLEIYPVMSEVLRSKVGNLF